MFGGKLLSCFCLAAVACPCYSNNNITETAVSRRIAIQNRAVDTYKTTCYRLQLLANWMSVLLKLMSAWTITTTRNIIENTQLEIDKGARSIPTFPERPTVGPPGSDCSLKNLQVALQTYIHFQGQLLQLKAVLGKRMLKNGKAKLDDTSVSLQGKIGYLDTLNKTALEMFKRLKQRSQDLISQGDGKISRILPDGKEQGSSNAFLTYFQDSKRKVLHHMQEVTQNLNQTRTLFQTADFFQNLGRSLDRIFG
ncbi:hypothetical protein AVEN_174218-1 [Araneus ventricosus]|uniref:Uncharacterized protein n=1 Tax=Araneus ventricosus TaxID=182803 RepID=A0A4Y2IXC3_ARAVE|nr:hypothetical protein AVEN_174218-1 [Araneus ventricosus]